MEVYIRLQYHMPSSSDDHPVLLNVKDEMWTAYKYDHIISMSCLF